MKRVPIGLRTRQLAGPGRVDDPPIAALEPLARFPVARALPIQVVRLPDARTEENLAEQAVRAGSQGCRRRAGGRAFPSFESGPPWLPAGPRGELS